jgi:hypothetical protein
MKQDAIKRVTLRIPIALWRRLQMAKARGDILYIHSAAIEGIEGFLAYIETKGKGKK